MEYKELLNLSKSNSLGNGEFDSFVKEVLMTLGTELKVPRVSFWTIDQNKESITNQALYDSTNNSFEYGDILKKEDFPSFFNAFQTNLIINVDDALNDPKTSEFKESYLIPKNIKSLLDAQVWINGSLFGVICLEQTETIRNWSKDDELYVSTSASYVSQAYLSKLRVEEESLRKETEANYEKVFNDKQNLINQLSEYSFFASHQLRSPVTTIISLVDAVNDNIQNNRCHLEAMALLKKTTAQLDSVVKEMHLKLEDN